ncbi:MAG: tRNA (adenosine(37)-N6)-threonylcarbamoyltransferase complex ATPase subunit type 1 TsaE [Sulfuriferula sp.]
MILHTVDDLPLRYSRFLADEAATLNLGADLAKTLSSGAIVYLHGNLGAGKTTLTRGILRGLGYTGKVKSPTYTLVEVYTVFKLHLYHFDLYRFNDASEWDEGGFGEYCDPASICLIEWPEKAAERLPEPDLRLHLTPNNEGRSALIEAFTQRGKLCLNRLAEY